MSLNIYVYTYVNGNSSIFLSLSHLRYVDPVDSALHDL